MVSHLLKMLSLTHTLYYAPSTGIDCTYGAISKCVPATIEFGELATMDMCRTQVLYHKTNVSCMHEFGDLLSQERRDAYEQIRRRLYNDLIDTTVTFTTIVNDDESAEIVRLIYPNETTHTFLL